MCMNKKGIISIIMWIIVTIIIGSLILFTVKGCNDHNEVAKNKVFIKARINDIYTVRYSDYCAYSFQYRGAHYYGTGRYYSNYGHVGDSILVILNKNDPNNNKTVENYQNYSTLEIIGFALFAILLLWWKFRK